MGSNTRHAESGNPLRQERYASSGEFQRGLMANLVAKRVAILDDPKDRELIWFLQLISHREGSLEKVGADLVSRFPQEIATRSMLKLGTKCGQVYNAKQVKAVRDELKEYAHRFPLDGDIDIWELGQDEEETSLPAPRRSKARIAPDSYPAAAFVEVCRAAASEIAKDLMRLCLDPAT